MGGREAVERGEVGAAGRRGDARVAGVEVARVGQHLPVLGEARLQAQEGGERGFVDLPGLGAGQEIGDAGVVGMSLPVLVVAPLELARRIDGGGVRFDPTPARRVTPGPPYA